MAEPTREQTTQHDVTHIVSYDAWIRGIVRAYCGAFVHQREIAEHVTVATCARCRELDAAHEAACNELEI